MSAAGSGTTQTTFYRWRAKYVWLEVSEAQRLKSLEDEYPKPRQMLAGQRFDMQALKAVLAISDEARGLAQS